MIFNIKKNVLIGSLLCLMTKTVFAVTFNVTTTDDIFDGQCNKHCSLREAIQAANSSAGADDIFLPKGNYLLTRTGNKEDSNKTGDLDIRDTVIIKGENREETMIDGVEKDRVFEIHKGSVLINHVTVKNGKLYEQDYSYGGGIYARPATDLTLQQVTVTKNADYSDEPWGGGGGVFSFGNLSISDSDITDNFSNHLGGGLGISRASNNKMPALKLERVKVKDNGAYRYGGGIFTQETSASIYLSLIQGNKVSVRSSDSWAYGGGLCNRSGGSITVTDSTITFNTAIGNGGGVYANSDKPFVVRRSVIEGNSALDKRGNGGGLLVTLLDIEDSSITHNQADQVAGAVSASANTFMRNVTISNNRSRVGAVALYNGDMRFDYVTLANNTAQERTAGIFMRLTSQLTITNSIVSSNTLNGVTQNCEISGPINSFGYNIANDTNCDFNDPTDLITDPQLLPLAHAGYNTTLVHPLMDSSPAIDSANPKDLCPATDQVGFPRPYGKGCDRGAYEWRRLNSGGIEGSDRLGVN
jgi:CSLREA domain-containing protein